MSFPLLHALLDFADKLAVDETLIVTIVWTSRQRPGNEREEHFISTEKQQEKTKMKKKSQFGIQKKILIIRRLEGAWWNTKENRICTTGLKSRGPSYF